MPTTWAIPPAATCTLYERSRSNSTSSPVRERTWPLPSRSMNWPACCCPVTISTSVHAGALQQLQRVVDHRPAPDGEQVLVRDARQLLEARRGAAGGDQAFHAGDAIAASASWPRAASEAGDPGGDAEHGDAHPHRRVAVGAPHLQPEERRQRPPDRPGAAEEAHVGTADVGRSERGDDRLGGRHPEHLADHEDQDHERDHGGRAVPVQEQERNAHHRHRDARASATARRAHVQRVSRSWKTVTSSGLTIISTPQAAGARWCVVVTEIGSSVSVAT